MPTRYLRVNDARIVVVTGAAQNIGAAIAARFLDNGDTVICADLREPDNAGVDYIETNVAEEASVEALMAAVADRHGRWMSWSTTRVFVSKPRSRIPRKPSGIG